MEISGVSVLQFTIPVGATAADLVLETFDAGAGYRVLDASVRSVPGSAWLEGAMIGLRVFVTGAEQADGGEESFSQNLVDSIGFELLRHRLPRRMTLAGGVSSRLICGTATAPAALHAQVTQAHPDPAAEVILELVVYACDMD